MQISIFDMVESSTGDLELGDATARSAALMVTPSWGVYLFVAASVVLTVFLVVLMGASSRKAVNSG